LIAVARGAEAEPGTERDRAVYCQLTLFHPR
jgi:hypothetical protein